MLTTSQALATLALGAALLGGCAVARVPGADNGLTPYPLAREPQAGDIIHLPTGITMNAEQALEMIGAAKVIYIGEMHSNVQAHEVQRRIIEEVERRNPGKVAIGMEMFRVPQQAALDRWSRGELSELEFLKESQWYGNWGADFALYRGILTLARERRLDVLALNPAKEVQKQFALSDSAALPPGIVGQVPETDFSDPFQRALLEAIFQGHDAGKQPAAASDEVLGSVIPRPTGRPSEARIRMFNSFYRTQILWEESMASRIVDYLNSPAGEGKKMVVITGGFHVRHGLGVPRKALRRAAWPYVIVLPTETEIPEEYREELTMDVSPPEIPLLIGDFAWMVPYEDVQTKKVRLGVMMRTDGETVVVDKVLPGSPAEAVGIASGDVFVSLDEFPIKETGDVILVISGKKPDETVKIILRRAGAEMTFTPVLKLAPEPPDQHPKQP